MFKILYLCGGFDNAITTKALDIVKAYIEHGSVQSPATLQVALSVALATENDTVYEFLLNRVTTTSHHRKLHILVREAYLHLFT
jgi:hypothetical protein